MDDDRAGTPSDDAAKGARVYRLYCFDENGSRLPPEPIVADDDVTAIALVRLALHKKCELWHGDRLVHVVPEERPAR